SQLNAGFRQAFAELLCRVGDRFDLVEVDLVRNFFRQVDDLVESMRQEQDVLLLNGGRKRAVRQVVDLAGDVVTHVLELAEAGMAVSALRKRLAELGKRLADQRALPLEQLIEAVLARNQAELQALTTPAKPKADRHHSGLRAGTPGQGTRPSPGRPRRGPPPGRAA